jgi:hypothetical protein
VQPAHDVRALLLPELRGGTPHGRVRLLTNGWSIVASSPKSYTDDALGRFASLLLFLLHFL